jgi:hypothetical protein
VASVVVITAVVEQVRAFLVAMMANKLGASFVELLAEYPVEHPVA